MTPELLRSRLQGVIAFPVTPFRADLSLDLDGLRRNLRALLKHSVCAVVAAGGTGELYSLAPAEHLAVVKATVEETAGRAPVLAAIGYNTALGADFARDAVAAGADGLLMFPPYYPGADDAGLVEYYRMLAATTPAGALIYTRDWFNPGPALCARLAEAIPNLIAWKDGQGDARRLQILRERVGERLHWIGGAGDDLVPTYYALGLRAYTSSIANVAPRLSLRLHELASAGDSAALAPLMQELVVPLYELRARRKGYEVSAMKAMMDELGLVGGLVRPPLANLAPEDLTALKAMLPKWRTWI